MTDEKTPEELEAEAAAEAEAKAAAEAAAKTAPKPRKKAPIKVEAGSEVDLGDEPGHLCFPDGGVSSHRGPARLTTPGEYRFVTATGETTYQVK